MTQTARSRSVLTLFTAAENVQCHRVRMVLAAKGVGYDRAEETLGKPSEELLQFNPYGDVPTLLDRDLVLYQPALICEYLDERYPHPPLMPVDPLSRARLRLACVRIEREWLPLIDAIQAGGRPSEPARRKLRDSLMEALPLFKASKFFLNPEMSLADCLVAPVIWRLPMLNVQLPREGKPILDYGERIFRGQGFARSLTTDERALHEMNI
ncbi:MAG TPA: glutathione S-transferase N-terminal domain-containing protein [Rhodanobacteraceae bacterium]|nr:glutathione S-transferase N-terminal domain-containing protein [Rhodanobacteraceae bacterium]